MPPPASLSLLLRKSVIALGFVFLASIHAGVIGGLINRPPDLDETEQLQGSIMMARGERIYTGFFEHHAPFLFEVLSTFAPSASGEQALHLYLIRSRILTAVFGTMAFAAAAWIVWKASGRAYAVLIFVALILSRPAVWGRAFAEVRSEPVSLAFWWTGAVLLVMPRADTTRNALARGFGIGLIVLACLWNPKWPVASLVMGIIFLLGVRADWRIRRGRATSAVLMGIAAGGLGLAAVVTTTGLSNFFEHTFGFTTALVQWSRTMQLSHQSSVVVRPWEHCPPLFRLVYVVPAASIVALGAWRRRDVVRDPRLVWSILAVAAAALIEIRFVYPYPALWLQYFVLWSIVAAIIFALVPPVCLNFIEHSMPAGSRATKAAAAVLTLLALIAAFNAVPVDWRVPNPHALSSKYLRAHLGADDTVWTDMARFPLGAHTASYYWFGFRDVIPAALQYAQTPGGAKVLPPLAQEDLPPCRLERGLEPHLRFLASERHYAQLPVVKACFQRLRGRGLVIPTPFDDVYAVVRSAPR